MNGVIWDITRYNFPYMPQLPVFSHPYPPSLRSATASITNVMLLIPVVFAVVVAGIPSYWRSRFTVTCLSISKIDLMRHEDLTANFITSVFKVCHMWRASALRFGVLLAPYRGDRPSVPTGVLDLWNGQES